MCPLLPNKALCSIARIQAPYKNISKEKGLFDIQQRTYAQQYSQIYFVRLAALLPALQSQAQQKWASSKSNYIRYMVQYIMCSRLCRAHH